MGKPLQQVIRNLSNFDTNYFDIVTFIYYDMPALFWVIFVIVQRILWLLISTSFAWLWLFTKYQSLFINPE